MASRLELLKEQFFDDDGGVLSGGLLYTYIVGTTTEKATYTTADGDVEQANPVVLDSDGRIPSDLYGVGYYKIVIKDSDEVTIDTIPSVCGINTTSLTTIGDYSNDFDAAITAIGATETTLYIDDTATMSTAVTIPATLTIVIQKGGVLDLDGNALTSNGEIIVQGGTITNDATIAINGQFSSTGTRKVFTSTGAVTFASGSVEKINVRWFGAVGDGATDDSTEINYAANSGRLNAIPIYFPTGNYYTTVSLNFTGANNDNVGYTMGWTIYGDGPEASQIYGDLALAYPVVDLSDNEHSMFRDIRVEGKSTGSQLCGILHGQASGEAYAYENKLFNVSVSGTFAEAAYINCGNDLTRIESSYFYGPIGVLITADSSALGAGIITSAYQTLCTTTCQGTQNYITNSDINGIGGDSNDWDSAIVADNVERVIIRDSYISQSGAAKAGILVDGDLGTGYDVPKVDFLNSRYENQTSPAAAGTFLWVSYDLGDSNIDGHIGGQGSPDTGQMIYLDDADIYGSKIRMGCAGTSEWTHTVTRNAGTEEIRDSEIWEQLGSTQLKSADVACFGEGNIIHLFAWQSAWAAIADYNLFYTNDYGPIFIGAPNGFNSIGTTTSLARKYIGHVSSDWQVTGTTGPAGSDETLDSYTVPGDIGLSNTSQNLPTLRIKAFGSVAANGNNKTIEGKFGVSGSETSIITNDQTAAPNGVKWEMTCEIIRTSSTTGWIYNCTMTVGAVTQTTTVGTVSADPDADTVKFLVTGDAAASDIVLSMFKVEIF